jgi:hypothetical protein
MAEEKEKEKSKNKPDARGTTPDWILFHTLRRAEIEALRPSPEKQQQIKSNEANLAECIYYKQHGRNSPGWYRQQVENGMLPKPVDCQ